MDVLCPSCLTTIKFANGLDLKTIKTQTLNWTRPLQFGTNVLVNHRGKSVFARNPGNLRAASWAKNVLCQATDLQQFFCCAVWIMCYYGKTIPALHLNFGAKILQNPCLYLKPKTFHHIVCRYLPQIGGISVQHLIMRWFEGMSKNIVGKWQNGDGPEHFSNCVKFVIKSPQKNEMTVEIHGHWWVNFVVLMKSMSAIMCP